MRSPQVTSFWYLSPLYARQSLFQSQWSGNILSQGRFQRHCLSTLETLARYKTLRITNTKDFKRLYPLLSSYVKNPYLAESVSEIIIDSAGWSSSPRYSTQESDSTDHAQLQCGKPDLNIQTHIHGLGLGDETTKKMMESLQWRARYYSKRDADHVLQKCCKFVKEGDKNYYQLKDDDQRRKYCAQYNEEEEQLSMNYSLYHQTAVIIILSLCKNVATLRVGSSDVDLDLLGDFLFKANYNLLPKPQLQRLECVEIVTKDDTIFGDQLYFELDFMAFFQRFHRLPAIQSISMEAVTYYQPPRSLFVPRTSNIRKIRIGHSALPSQLLHTIILIPKTLEELHVSMGGRRELEGGGPMMNLSKVSQALLQHRRTLRVLDLDIDYAHDGFRDASKENIDAEVDYVQLREVVRKYEAEEYGLGYLQLDEELSMNNTRDQDSPESRDYGTTIGSLHDFTAMIRLRIGLKALMGVLEFGHQPPFRLSQKPPFRLVDALPPNLEYLCFYGYRKGDNEEIDDHVQELLSKRAEKLPRLKEIEGIDKPVLDLGSIYELDDDDENLWQRPERNFSWEKA